VKPRTPTSFTLIPSVHPVDGKPVVVIDFGRLGRITLGADDVDRFVAALEAKLREARELGTT
jgi:hypothetical protein